MAEDLIVDPTISELIQLIEEKDNALRELKGRIDGICTVVKVILEQINRNIISGQMKLGSNDVYLFEAKVYKIANRIDMFETKFMHLLSDR